MHISIMNYKRSCIPNGSWLSLFIIFHYLLLQSCSVIYFTANIFREGNIDDILSIKGMLFSEIWEKALDLEESNYIKLIKKLSPFFDQNNKNLYVDGEFLNTSYVQDLIYKNQNPSNCDDRKYLIIYPHKGGIGSALHVYGAALGKALELNRTAIWSPGADYKWIKGFCSKNNFDCYLRPLSKCNPTIKMNGDKFLKYPLHKPSYLSALRRFVPQIISQNILKYSSFPKEIWYFYWRIQSTKYLYDLNKVTKKAVKDVTKKYIVNPKDRYDIAMHIRHADKGEEMKIVGTDKYYIPIKILEKNYKKNLSIFISSDDDKAIQWFKQNSKHQISYLDYPRRNEGYSEIIKTPIDISLKSFANIEEITKAKYQIGTINSNWIRLLLELSIMKGNIFQFFEVGDLKCLNEYQCKLVNEELNFNW